MAIKLSLLSCQMYQMRSNTNHALLFQINLHKNIQHQRNIFKNQKKINVTLNTKLDLFSPPFVCDLRFSAKSHFILSQRGEIARGWGDTKRTF